MLKLLDDIIKNPLIASNQKLINTISLYNEYWKKYSDDDSFTSKYNNIPNSYDRRILNFSTGEKAVIHWDVVKLHKYAQKNLEIQKVPLSKLNKILNDDISKYSQDTYEEAFNKVNSLHKHAYNYILIMDFSPMNATFIIDGRHKYMEYIKFKRDKLIPIYILKDEDCIQSIFYKRDLVTYCILHNLKVISQQLNSQFTQESVIDIEKLLD